MLMNTRQTAQIMNISAATLAAWRCKKRYNLRFYKVGRRVLYSQLDVEEFLKNMHSTAVEDECF
jgi:hypothetical protein